MAVCAYIRGMISVVASDGFHRDTRPQSTAAAAAARHIDSQCQGKPLFSVLSGMLSCARGRAAMEMSPSAP